MGTIPRVYSVLNTPIASLTAYEIAQLSNQPKVPQVVLLLNDQKKLGRFLDNDSQITIDRGRRKNIHRTQFMASHLPPVYSTGDIATINNLIVSGQHSKAIVSSIKKYNKSLHPYSNILLLNPPFGTIEHLYRNVWTTSDSRPNVFIGITNEKEESISSKSEEFRITVTTSQISMRLSPIPRDFSKYSNEQGAVALDKLRNDNDLLKLLEATTRNENSIIPLSMSLYPYGELFLIRLERLIIDSCIEPLAALFGCTYKGELLMTEKSKDLIMKLIKEQLWILNCAYRFLNRVPNASIALDSERLYELVLKELRDSSDVKSRLNNALNQLNQTNINQLTGYFVQLANYKKLDCRWNEVITGLVKGKVGLTKYKATNYKYL